MCDFKAKMHQIRLRLGLSPTPRWGSLQRYPRPSSFRGLLLRGGKGRIQENRGGAHGRGKGEKGEGRRRRGSAPQTKILPTPLVECSVRALTTRQRTGWGTVVQTCSESCISTQTPCSQFCVKLAASVVDASAVWHGTTLVPKGRFWLHCSRSVNNSRMACAWKMHDWVTARTCLSKVRRLSSTTLST